MANNDYREPVTDVDVPRYNPLTGHTRPAEDWVFPPIVIPRRNTTTEESERAETKPRVTNMSRGTDGLGIPIALGRVHIPGIRMTPPVDYGGSLIIAYAFCLGPIKAFVSYDIGGQGSAPAGVTVQTFKGDHTSISSLLQSAYPTTATRTIAYWGVQHRKIAYMVLKIDPDSTVWGSVPDVWAVIEGSNEVYDPRTSTSGYSENLALHALHVMRHAELGARPDAELDLTSVQDAANFCDALVSGEKRYYGGTYVTAPSPDYQVAAEILSQAGMFPFFHLGKWGVGYYDSTIASSLTIEGGSAGHLAEPSSPQEKSTHASSRFTLVRCSYSDEVRDWETMEQIAQSGVYSGGNHNETTIQAPGVFKASVAARSAEDFMNESLASRRLPITMDERGMTLRRGNNVLTKEIGIDGVSVDMELDLNIATLAGNAILGSDEVGEYLTLSAPTWGNATVEVDLSAVRTVADSAITFSTTLGGDSASAVTVSFNGGSSWSASIPSGGSIPGLTVGAAPPASKMLVKFGLTTTAVIPKMRGVRVRVGTQGCSWRVLSVAPKLPGKVDVLLGEPFTRSTATATVTSTGGATFSRSIAREDPDRPDSTTTPPAPGSLTLTEVERDIAGKKVQQIKAVWVLSANGFISSYTIKLTVGGVTTIVGSVDRTVDEYFIPVSTPGVSHTVTVKAVTSSGVTASASASITPGGTAPSISISQTSKTRLIAPWQNKGGTDYDVGVQYDISMSITDSAGIASHVEVYQDESMLGTVAASGLGSFGFTIGNARYWGVSNAGTTFHGINKNGGNVIKCVLVCEDGRRIDSNSLTLSSPGVSDYAHCSSATAYNRDLLAVGSNGHSFHSAVGSSPARGDSNWYDSDHEWNKSWNGEVTSSDWTWDADEEYYYKSITFPVAHRTSPAITLGPETAGFYWVENPSETGFRLCTNVIDPYGGCNGACYWMSEDRKP